VDLVTANGLKPRFRELIGEEYALRRAGDLAPFERERQAIILDGGR
jgi:hypothetical protein